MASLYKSGLCLWIGLLPKVNLIRAGLFRIKIREFCRYPRRDHLQKIESREWEHYRKPNPILSLSLFRAPIFLSIFWRLIQALTKRLSSARQSDTTELQTFTVKCAKRKRQSKSHTWLAREARVVRSAFVRSPRRLIQYLINIIYSFFQKKISQNCYPWKTNYCGPSDLSSIKRLMI